MQNREPIFHDRQKMESTTPQNTASTTFVDVTDGTLTTKDLSQNGTYMMWVPILIQASLNNTLASFRLTLDGNQIGDVSTITLRVKELDVGYTFTGNLSGIGAGQVIQLQYKTDIGTLTLEEFSIMFDGIPTIRVVE